jgi:hypothetical protein
MGPSCSSLAVFDTQGFYVPPPSPRDHQGVSKGWMYATVSLACVVALCLAVVLGLSIRAKLTKRAETQPLLAN